MVFPRHQSLDEAGGKDEQVLARLRMVSQRSHQSLSFNVRLINTFVWRQRVFLQGIKDCSRDFLHSTICQPLELLALLVRTLIVDASELSGNQAQIVVVDVAMCQQFQQAFERDGLYRLATARLRCCFRTFGHAYSIDKEEAVLAEGIWSDVA